MVIAWKSKDLSNENIKPPATSDNSVNSRLGYFNVPKFRVEFNGCCSKPDRVTFASKKIINLYAHFETKS